jgi:hypothetical protein
MSEKPEKKHGGSVNVQPLVRQLICEYCEKEIKNTFISIGSGVAHELCYYKKHPFIHKKTFDAVLKNMDDSVLVWQLLEKYLTDVQKDLIRVEFNKTMQDRYNERIELLSA